MTASAPTGSPSSDIGSTSNDPLPGDHALDTLSGEHLRRALPAVERLDGPLGRIHHAHRQAVAVAQRDAPPTRRHPAIDAAVRTT